MSIGYINGVFEALESIRVSPLDRGFLFGDGVYEVIPCYGGTPFRMEDHLRRLERSLSSVRILNPHQPCEWKTLLADLVRRNGGGDQLVYLQVTRGVAPRDHGFPDTDPTTFAMSRPWKRESRPRPADAISVPDNRWQRCDVKSISLLGNVLLRQAAIDEGASESILLRDGRVTEGAASNVFVVSGEVVATPPESPSILSGITREVALNLMQKLGVEASEADISESALRGADEIWVTSSSMELRPIVRLDGAAVGGGQPGPVWTKVFEAFRSLTG